MLRAHLESSLDERLSSTLLLRERSAPMMVSTGLPELDALTGGLPRGALSEIVGPASSGRTGVMLAALVGATRRQEACALVDASDSFDPASAWAAGVDMERLLWVRCNEQAPMQRDKNDFSPLRLQRFGLACLEQVLKVTDLLLQGGGFGMVALDLGDIAAACVRRVPLTSWFRFRRAVEHTETVLLVIEPEACAKTCASLVLELQRQAICAHNTNAFQPAGEESWKAAARSEAAVPSENIVSHAALLRGMQVRAQIVRSWMQRKPVQPAGALFSMRVHERGM